MRYVAAGAVGFIGWRLGADPGGECSQETDHFVRSAWIGPSWPLYKSMLRDGLPGPPLQYPSLELGYSSKAPEPSLDELRRKGAAVEETLKHEPEAAPAPGE